MSPIHPDFGSVVNKVAQANTLPASPHGHAVSTVEECATTESQNSQSLEESADQATDDATKQQFLWHVHQYLGEHARLGDTKAAFAGAIASALLGALYGAKAHVHLLREPVGQWALSTWLSALGGAFLIASISGAIWAIVPRRRSTQPSGFIFWDSIAAQGSAELLQSAFNTQSVHALNDHLLHHIFDIATTVCAPKYRAVSFCMWTLCLGGILAAIALAL